MKEYLPQSVFSFLKSIFKKINSLKLVYLFSCLTIGQSLYMILPFLLGYLIDKILVQNAWSISVLFLFPLIWLISVFFTSSAKIFISIITQDVRKISKDLIFRHIISMPTSFYAIRGAGEIENLMNELSLNSRYIVNESLTFFFRIIISLGIAMITIYSVSSELSVIFLVWTLMYIFISYISAYKSTKHVKESLISSAEVSASTVDVIQNHELIPAFGTEVFEVSRFEFFLNNEKKSYYSAQMAIDIADFIQRLMQAMLPLSIVMYLIYSAVGIKMTPGEITGLFTITLIIVTQIGDFGRGVLSFFEMKERMKTALNKLSCPSSNLINKSHINKIEPRAWDINFLNVNFTYDPNHFGIKNLNLEIKSNEKIGIIGYSGAGKTTLIKLLRGYIKPTNGQILIGGIDINKIDEKFLTKNIVEVSQSIPLFHRTIRENVAYGCENVSDDRIWDALKLAQLDQFVKKIPGALNAVIGVRGQKISGGERARLAIARAVVREAKIIILDEATAAVDSQSEMSIQKSIENLMSGQTLIVIAHRLSTLRMMNRIIVLNEGKIIAEGTHNELINKNDLYARLWNIQLMDANSP